MIVQICKDYQDLSQVKKQTKLRCYEIEQQKIVQPENKTEIDTDVEMCNEYINHY